MTKRISYLGKTLSLQEWSNQLEIPLNTIITRMKQTDDPEKILDITYRERQKTMLRNLYQFLVEYKEQNNGLSPSIQEIRSGINEALSPSRIIKYLRTLSKLGLIRYGSNHRSIRVLGGAWVRPKVDRLEEKLNLLNHEVSHDHADPI